MISAPHLQSKSKYRVKIKFLLLDLLSRIGKGQTAPEIAKSYNWSKQRLFYWINKLGEEGLIRRTMRDSMNIYELSDQSKKILDGASRGVEEIQLHNIEFAYPVLKEGQFAPDKEWLWGKALFKAKKLSGCTVKLVGQTLIISVENLAGENSFKMAIDAKNIADNAIAWIKAQGFELGQGVQTRKPHFGLIGPLMKKISEQVQVSSDNYLIDKSRGGEVEFFTAEDADGFMRMPETLRGLTEAINRMEGMLGGMAQQQLAISNAIMLQATILQNQTKILGAIVEKLK